MRLCVVLLSYASCAVAFSYPSIPQHRFELSTRRINSCTLRKRCTTLQQAAANKLPGKRQGSNSEDRKTIKRKDAVRRVNSKGSSSSSSSSIQKKNMDSAASINKTPKKKKNIISEATASAAPLVQQGTEAVVDTLANTDAAYALLQPLHDWSTSRCRVAAAVESEKRSTASAEATLKQQQSATAWRSLLLPQVLAQPFADTYNAVLSAAAAPARLAASVEKTAEDISAAPEKIKRLVEDAAAAGTKTAETLASVPRRAREAAEAGAELRARAEKALEDGKETYESWRAAAESFPEESQRAVDVGVGNLAKASEAMEALPTRLPDLIENASDEAQLLAGDLAKSTADGMDAAGTALWAAAVDLGGSTAEQVLRRALSPVHDYWTSMSRVQAALDKERAALPSPSQSTEATAEDAQTTSALEKEMERMDLQEGAALLSAGAATQEADRGSRLGLRGKFAAWRRRRRSRSTAAATAGLADAGVSSSRRSSGDADGSEALEPNVATAVAVAGAGKDLAGGAAVDTDEAAAMLDGAADRLAILVVEEDAEGEARSDGARTFPGRSAGDSDEGTVATEGEFMRALAEREGTTVEEASSPGDAEESVGASPSPFVTVAAEGSISQGTSGLVDGASTPTKVNAQVGVGGSGPPVSGSRVQQARGDAVWDDAATTSAAGVASDGLKTNVDAVGDMVSVPRARTAVAVEVAGARRGQAVEVTSPVDAADSSDASGIFDDAHPDGEKRVADVVGQKDDTPDPGSAMAPSSADGDAAAAAAADLARSPAVPPSVATSAAIKREASSSSFGDAVGATSPLDNNVDREKGVIARVVSSSSKGETDTTAVGAAAVGEGAPGAVETTNSMPGPEPLPGLLYNAPAVDVDGSTTTDTASAANAASAATTPFIGSTAASAAVTTNETEPASPPVQTTMDAPTLVPPPAATRALEGDTETATSTAVPSLAVGNNDTASEERAAAPPAAADVKAAEPSAGSPRVGSESPVPVAEASSAGDGVASAEGRQGWGEWGVMSPAAEFLREWVETAVPKKKAQLKKSKEEVVCWERQWYPVAIANELPQRWLGDGTSVRFQMLGRDYELIPRAPYGPSTGGGTDADSGAWSCRAALAAARSLLEPTAKVPLRESSGLLWAWPDISPEGLAAAALASPPTLPDFSHDRVAEDDEATGLWRRLFRSQPARPQERRQGRRDDHKIAGGRSRHDVVHRELSCGYPAALRGLLACSHGAAVRAAAGGGSGAEGAGPGAAVMEEMKAGIDASLTSAGNAGFQASFNATGAQGQLSFTCPTVVEWRFSRPADRTAADGQEEDVAGPAPRRWLRRRLSGLGGDGREEHTSRGRRAGERRRGGTGDNGYEGDMRYIAVVLPSGEERTRVFSRLEMEPTGISEGRSLWWSQRIRRALLAKAIDAAANVSREQQQDGDVRIVDNNTKRSSPASNQHSPPALEEWLDGAMAGGSF